MIVLRAEDKIILKSIKIHPNPTELEQLNGLIPMVEDWDYLISTIIDRGIAPLLFKKLPLLTNSIFIPEAVKIKLQQTYYKTFSRSALLYEHFKRIAEAFTAQNIPVIGLKGIYLSEWLYQDIGLRQFSDIDLLVKEEDGMKCLVLLENLGYKRLESGKLSEFVENQFDMVHYPPRVLQGVSIEIHIKLHLKTEKYNVIVSELWKNSIPATIHGVEIQALAINDLLIHLCLHLDKHFRVGHVQFTCFNDITNILERYSGTIDWNPFTETCQRYNCEEVVFKYLVMVHTYINATVPIDIIQKYNYLLTENDEQLFCRYLQGNNDSHITLSEHFVYLEKLQHFSEKVKYGWDVLFPSKSFMIHKYQINNPKQVLFYYPYRYYIGIRGVINHWKRRTPNPAPDP